MLSSIVWHEFRWKAARAVEIVERSLFAWYGGAVGLRFADIYTLPGPEFLAEVKAAHLLYGQVLGITRAKALPADMTALVEPLREVGRAIGDYALQVLATADRERPDTIESARTALHPLDRCREGAARRAGSKSDKGESEGSEVGVDTPVPEVPQ